jgi:hypothetical protein
LLSTRMPRGSQEPNQKAGRDERRLPASPVLTQSTYRIFPRRACSGQIVLYCIPAALDLSGELPSELRYAAGVRVRQRRFLLTHRAVMNRLG